MLGHRMGAGVGRTGLMPAASADIAWHGPTPPEGGWRRSGLGATRFGCLIRAAERRWLGALLPSCENRSRQDRVTRPSWYHETGSVYRRNRQKVVVYRDNRGAFPSRGGRSRPGRPPSLPPVAAPASGQESDLAIPADGTHGSTDPPRGGASQGGRESVHRRRTGAGRPAASPKGEAGATPPRAPHFRTVLSRAIGLRRLGRAVG
jgi:hypothetical protein